MPAQGAVTTTSAQGAYTTVQSAATQVQYTSSQLPMTSRGAVTSMPAQMSTASTYNLPTTTSAYTMPTTTFAAPAPAATTFSTAAPAAPVSSSAYTMPSTTLAAPAPATTTFTTAAPAAPVYTQAANVTPSIQTVTAAPMQSQIFTSQPRTLTSQPQVIMQQPQMYSQPQVIQQAPVAVQEISTGRNLLLGGNVISERVVSYEELVANGVLRTEEATVVTAPVVADVIQQQDNGWTEAMEQEKQQLIAEQAAEEDAAAAYREQQQQQQQYVQEAGTVGENRLVEQDVMVEQQVVVEQQQQGGPIEGLLNQAFVYIKPHAVTEVTINTVRNMLQNYGIAITGEGDLTADVIDERKLIDQHYYSIASKATMLTPDQLPVDDAKFQAAFGLPWADALPNALNAMDAMAALESNVDEISQLWNAAKDNKKLVKLGGGFYCGLLEKPGYQPIYSFNCFFMSMRNDYVAPGASIHWFAVEWDERAIPWADFRGKVLGPTDPANAPADSIRGTILANWQELGLGSQPNTGNNGVHASASPLEALYERMNWLGMPCAEDMFGNFLLQCQVPPEFIDHCAVDPQVNLPEGNTGSVWDYLEDADASTCVDKFVNLVNINMG